MQMVEAPMDYAMSRHFMDALKPEIASAVIAHGHNPERTPFNELALRAIDEEAICYKNRVDRSKAKTVSSSSKPSKSHGVKSSVSSTKEPAKSSGSIRVLHHHRGRALNATFASRRVISVLIVLKRARGLIDPLMSSYRKLTREALRLRTIQRPLARNMPRLWKGTM